MFANGILSWFSPKESALKNPNPPTTEIHQPISPQAPTTNCTTIEQAISPEQPMKLRGGGAGDVCCGLCAGLLCFECCEECC